MLLLFDLIEDHRPVDPYVEYIESYRPNHAQHILMATKTNGPSVMHTHTRMYAHTHASSTPIGNGRAVKNAKKVKNHELRKKQIRPNKDMTSSSLEQSPEEQSCATKG